MNQPAVANSVERDDRVLPFTRVLSVVIVPFLLLGFAVLYLFPGHTDHLWAWTIAAHLTSEVLASAYLGGAYFFVRAAMSRDWLQLRTGFLAVALFASLLGVATIVHWNVFGHSRVAFWLWAGLYFTTPFLVVAAWVANERVAAPARDRDLRLGTVSRACVGLVGLGALLQGLVLFVHPTTMIDSWPWPLTPLAARAVGAVFCLGSAGLFAAVDGRWSSIRLMLEVESLMVALMLLAAVRSHGELRTGQPLTWLLLSGFVVVLVGSAALYTRMRRLEAAALPPSRPRRSALRRDQ